MNTPTKTLALVIDGDNAQLAYIKQVIQFCEVLDGTLSIKNAYGDWKQPPLSSRHQKLIELGVNPVQQNRVASNATDFALAMDVALMLDKGEADIYILVSSDNHFTTVCERIREKGAQVIGIGSKGAASSKLRKSCDAFFYVEEIVKSQSEASPTASPAPKPKPPTKSKSPTKSAPAAKPKPAAISKPTAKASPAPKPKPAIKSKTPTTSSPAAKPKAATAPKPAPKASPAAKPKTPTATKPPVKAAPAAKPKIKPAKATPDMPQSSIILKMLTEAYQSASPQKGGWVVLGEVGNILRKLDGEFDQQFANKKLSNWFKAYPDEFEVKDDRVRMK